MRSTRLTNGIGPLLLFSILLSPVHQGNGATVTTCDEPSLRAALADGGTVTLACDGTITLTSTLDITRDATLDAQGHQVTISGGNAVRVFWVAPSVQFTLKGLTVANGKSTNGAGLFNDHGSVSIVSCVLSNNSAVGVDGTYTVIPVTGGPFPSYNFIVTLPTPASGGAVFNGGTLSVAETTFVGNVATGARGAEYLVALVPYPGRPGSAGSDGTGGAIFNDGSVGITRCTFADNLARGGPGGSGGPGAPNPGPSGGPGGSGGDGGGGLGGAITSMGFLAVGESAFIGNNVTGGIGGSGGRGSDSPLPGGGGGGGSGGTGGFALGGAVFATNGSVWMTNTTAFDNSAVGSEGGNGGGGGNSTATSVAGGPGGNGGNGANGRGGALHVTVSGLLLNNTASGNTASGGAGGNGGPGGLGQRPSRSGASGLPRGGLGGALSGGQIQILNTILNASVGSSNCAGAFVDGGHNICSDGSCNFTTAGSLNNTDPKLGPLADNGGPTLTLSLLAGSPAIDAADSSASPAFDQRGVIRPLGSGSDIGAFERLPDAFRIRSLVPAGEQIEVRGFGIPNRAFRLLGSDNLSNWNQVGAGAVSPSGIFFMSTTNGPAQKFFRTVSP